jgi:AAA family ATP:ADP antiporter
MESLGQRVVNRLTNTRGGERTVALLMFAYSFLAMTSHNILTPLTEGTFIKQLGADNMPWVQLAAGLLVGVIMQLYTHASGRMPRRRVIPVTQAALVGLLIVFWMLLGTSAAWVTVSFYFFGLILGVLLISQFWTLANDVYDARQAKRLFGFIGGGASLGGALGAAISKFLIYEVGRYNLLLFSAAALLGCIAIVTVIIDRQGPSFGGEGGGIDERPISGGEALRAVAASRHLRAIALITVFAAAGAAIVKQQLSMAAEARGGDADAIGVFLASVDMYLSLAGFVVQVALTSRIHRSLGLAFALLLLPAALGSTATAILISGALWAPAVARVLDSTLRYTVDKTTREVLFLPLPADLKYRVKPFIDVTADRFARAVAALVILPLIKPWGLGLDWQHLSYASLVMTALWIGVALVAWREYLRAFRASIVSRDIAPATIRTDVADAATIEALVEELSSPDERAVVYAIDLLEALNRRNLVTPLLLQHESPRVRAKALRVMARFGSPIASRWIPTIERMVQDEDVDVRAAALHALAGISHEDTAVLLRRHLDDAEPRVVVTAAIALANSGRPEDIDAAEIALLRFVSDTREVAVAARKEAATALGRIEHPRFRPLVVPLLNDSDINVVRKAIKSARALGASDGLFVPALLSLLGHRALKAQAREALVGYGEEIVPLLAYSLADTREQLWIRRHIPVTLASIGTSGAMDALVAALDDSDGFLRYKAIMAIEKLRRDNRSVSCPRQTVEKVVIRETSRYYNGLTLQHNLLRDSLDAGDSLLGRALEDKLRRSLDRIYRLLGLLYHIEDVAAARFTIEQGERRRRAAAVEYLDNLLGGVVRRRVMPILDDTPLSEKVRYANGVLRSRPRDIEDTLAQLIYDDDPVIAASAIHFAAQRQFTSLESDFDYVTTHRQDAFVREAALWASRSGGPSSDGLPVVALVDRIRVTPVFAALSIDELFRVAEVGQEIRHQAGREISRVGQPASEVFFLLEGALEVTGESGPGKELTAPAVVNVEEVLQGIPLKSTIRAIEHSIGFRVPTPVFVTMVSDNILMAQSLFRLLLGQSPYRLRTAMASPSQLAAIRAGSSGSERLFRQDPLLAGATAAQLLALRASASEVTLTSGAVVFDIDAPPATYQILEGEVRLESPDQAPILASAGAMFGVADTLAGTPSGWKAVVTAQGRALRLDRDDLFGVMADHVDLMQNLFTEALRLPNRESSRTAIQPEHPYFA